MNHPVEERPEEHVCAHASQESGGQQTLSIDEILLPVRSGLGQDHDPQSNDGQAVEDESQDASQAEDTWKGRV